MKPTFCRATFSDFIPDDIRYLLQAEHIYPLQTPNTALIQGGKKYWELGEYIRYWKSKHEDQYVKPSFDLAVMTLEDWQAIFGAIKYNCYYEPSISVIDIEKLSSGVAKLFYSNGNIGISASYKEDLLDGGYYWFYEEGTRYLETVFKGGKVCGKVNWFCKDGNLCREEYYFQGERKSDNFKECEKDCWFLPEHPLLSHPFLGFDWL